MWPSGRILITYILINCQWFIINLCGIGIIILTDLLCGITSYYFSIDLRFDCIFNCKHVKFRTSLGNSIFFGGGGGVASLLFVDICLVMFHTLTIWYNSLFVDSLLTSMKSLYLVSQIHLPYRRNDFPYQFVIYRYIILLHVLTACHTLMTATLFRL